MTGDSPLFLLVYPQSNANIEGFIMGFVGWIATGIFIGILIGVVMKIFAKKK